MKAIIFGINGQDGHYLKNLLEASNIETIGVSRSLGFWLKGDVSDFSFVDELIKTEKPDYIFHLAANSTTRHDAILENHQTISTGSVNILESAYQHCRNARIFLSGSAMQFKNTGKPIDESSPFDPSSPYSVARIHTVYAARYFRQKGMKVYMGYFFNHESPLRTPRHVSRMIVDQVKKIKINGEGILEIGNVNVRKEWNFAGDFANAINLLVNQENQFEVVLGSGKAYSIEDWVNVCFSLVGLNYRNYLVEKSGFLPEYECLVSDPSLLFSLGYSPKVNFETLADLMMG